jgi:hypothetical protein
MLLVTLLDTDDLDLDLESFGTIVKMRQQYLRLFQRKLKSANCGHIQYNHFRCVHNIRAARFSLVR